MEGGRGWKWRVGGAGGKRGHVRMEASEMVWSRTAGLWGRGHGWGRWAKIGVG